MIELYEFALSGNCHKARLMLNLLGLAYTSVPVNKDGNEQKSADFLAMNPFGQVPVLKDGGTVIRDSQAILVYLARQYGGAQWWPDDAASLASITGWLSSTANEVARGPNALRLHYKFGRAINVEEALQTTRTLLDIMSARLSAHPWIATDNASIADIALYPYIALASEGQFDIAPYPAVTAWLQRVRSLPGYAGMPGM